MIDAQRPSALPGPPGSRPPGLTTTAPGTYALLRDAADWNPDATAAYKKDGRRVEGAGWSREVEEGR